MPGEVPDWLHGDPCCRGDPIRRSAAAGNSSTLKQYSFIDDAPLSTNYYRLKEVDLNGNSSYSNILLVNLSQAAALTILQNPVQDLLQLQLNSGSTAANSLTLFDMWGRKRKALSLPNGPQTIDISNLAVGTYILRLTTGNGDEINEKFVKSN